jgi:hypothetical protein
LPIIFFDRWWDWAFFAKMMEFKLRYMSKMFKERGMSISAEKDAKKMLICAELLKRLREDEKEENMLLFYNEYLFRLLKKHMRSWWD